MPDEMPEPVTGPDPDPSPGPTLREEGAAVPSPEPREMTDDLDALLDALPPEIGERMRALPQVRDLIEVVMDLGRRPEARFGGGGEDGAARSRDRRGRPAVRRRSRSGSFGDDNRAGIERTLHRISAIRNRSGKIVGLTCRVGRAVFGTIEIIDDLVEIGPVHPHHGPPGHRQDDDAA